MSFKSIFLSSLVIFFAVTFTNCSNNKTSSHEDSEGSDDTSEESRGYRDGTYCANIEYYYSKTGTNSTYVLQIEIEDNELVKILWPNGGWLDNSHFTPPDIEDGTAEFTSDQGVDYTVNIIGKGDDCNTSNYAETESSLVNQYKQDEEEEQRVKKQKTDDDDEEQNRIREDEKKKRQEEEKAIKDEEEGGN